MADEPTRDEPQPDTGLAADLWLAGQNWNEAWQRRQADVPAVIYHYTNATGLLGIVRSKQLWAFHAAFVNDSSEIRYVKRVLDPVRAELKGQNDQSLVHASLEQIDELFHGLVVSRYDVYLACFCEHGDQLSQWRGYPSTGGGYAIGFRTAVIGEGRPMRKVVYDGTDQRAILLELLMPPCEYLAASTEQSLSSEYLAKSLRLACEMTLANVVECSWCFKHRGFEEEHECRLIRLSARDGDPPYRIAPSFRATASGLLPYTALELEPGDGQPPIAEVVVGPSQHADLAVTAARQLLRSSGYEHADAMVKKSEIPLRV